MFVVGVTVTNAMLIAVRRRRRDIAILQSLGSTCGSVMAVGVWQGLTIGVAALAFGVPIRAGLRHQPAKVLRDE